MRELAAYAASRVLSNEEAVQVQEWIDALKVEVEELDKETVRECSACEGYFLCSDKRNCGSCRFSS